MWISGAFILNMLVTVLLGAAGLIMPGSAERFPLAALSANAFRAPAILQEPELPPGFYPVISTRGAALYRKDYSGGNPDFVQVIDLSKGASIQFLHGGMAGRGEDQGVYGGDNPKFSRQSMPKFWQQYSASSPNAFCVVTGQFFRLADSPTRLAFPLKTNGEVLTDGYGIEEYPDQKQILEIWPERADIQPLSRESLYGSTAPEILAGLTAEANKRAKQYAGRTFAGVDDRDGDGAFETVLFFSTLTAKQSDADEVLRSFGADKTIMFDGGGSAQLLCQGESYVSSDRLIPSAIGISGGEVLPLEATVIDQPGWQVLVLGEALAAEVEIQNTGSEAWQAAEMNLELAENALGLEETLPLPQDVQAGEVVVFSWSSEPLGEAGLYITEWRLKHNGRPVPGDPIRIRAVVLPPEMADRREEIAGQIGGWDDAQIRELEQSLRPGEEPSPDPAGSPSQNNTALVIDMEDAIWIPLAMLPVIIVLILVITGRRGGYVVEYREPYDYDVYIDYDDEYD